MTYLSQHLSFAKGDSHIDTPLTALPPAGSHLIITDTLNSPGHFVLYHLVQSAIQAKRAVAWVDFRAEGRTSWEHVFKKLGNHLPPASSPLFTHISPSSLPACVPSAGVRLFDEAGQPTLREVYGRIAKVLPSASDRQSTISNQTTPSETEGPMIILDGLSELLCMGFEAADVARFVRATLSACKKSGASLVSVAHGDHIPLGASSEPGSRPSAGDGAGQEADLVRRLIRLGGGGWWRVSNLASGRSGDVHGEISAHPLFPPSALAPTPSSTWTFPSIPRSQPLQYRLEANTVKVFAKGTGRGFL